MSLRVEMIDTKSIRKMWRDCKDEERQLEGHKLSVKTLKADISMIRLDGR